MEESKNYVKMFRVEWLPTLVIKGLPGKLNDKQKRLKENKLLFY